jgi:DNA-binding MurR/RpiR family transcriptional regulator
MADTSRITEPEAPDFGPAEAKAAEFLESHEEDAAFLSIGNLAEASGVSEATLSRLVRKLGFSRFAEYQDSLQRRVRERLTPRAKTSRTLGQDGGRAISLSLAARSEAERLSEYLPLIDDLAFERAARAIAGARRVFLAGLGVSRSLCYFLAFRLARFGFQVEHVFDQGTLERASGIGKRDAALAVGFVRMHPETIAFLEWSSSRGARTIAITESATTPLGRRAEIALAAPRGPISELGSLALPMLVANALAIRAAQLSKGKVDAAMRALEELDGVYMDSVSTCLSRGIQGKKAKVGPARRGAAKRR